MQRNCWDRWKPHGIDGKARNPEWKTSERDLRGKAIYLWAEGAGNLNHRSCTTRIKEGLWARLETGWDDLHTKHSKGEGNNGGPRGKGQRPPLCEQRASAHPCTYAMRNGGKKKHEQERWCITKILSFNLTFYGCPQCSGKQVMAHAATICGRRRRGSTP